jgi:hypothetical protein
MDPATKPSPVTSINTVAPAGAVVLLRAVIRGTPLADASIWKSVAGVSEPVAGLKTVTLVEPGEIKSVVGIIAERPVGDEKEVGRLPPFQRTIMPLVKPEPLTISPNPRAPGIALPGSSVDMVIVGGGACGVTVIVLLIVVLLPVGSVAV